MARAYRQPAPDLIADLVENGQDFAFFRAVSLALQATGQTVEERALQVQRPERLRFSVDPGLGFPAGDVLGVDSAGEGDERAFEIVVNFLGLHGSSSPLPSHFLETAAWSRGEEGVQQKFNDFFSDRLIWLLFLIWRKYRYDIRYRAGASDQFSDWMFALIGIAEPETRGSAHVPWAKLLTYLGVIAARTRSAEMIAGVIAHAFSLPPVTIRECQWRKVLIPEDQRAHAGLMNCALGEDMVIGDMTDDVAGKFTIVLRDLSFARFQDFLPSGKDHAPLKQLIEFMLRDQHAYDIRLGLAQRQDSPLVLSDSDEGHLGWSSFLGSGDAGQRDVLITARL